MAKELNIAAQFEDAGQQRAVADLGIWIFLATEILFFGVLFTAYTFTRYHHPGAFAAASRLTNVVLGSSNTAVLLTSSLTMALAVRAAKLGRRRILTAWLAATLVLGLAFLVIKAIEYTLDYQQHLVPGINFTYAGPDLLRAQYVELFFYLYFVATGVHALHLIIGVGVVGSIAVLAARGAFSKAYFTPVEVGGLYWHLVDVIWIFLYPLLYLVARA